MRRNGIVLGIFAGVMLFAAGCGSRSDTDVSGEEAAVTAEGENISPSDGEKEVTGENTVGDKELTEPSDGEKELSTGGDKASAEPTEPAGVPPVPTLTVSPTAAPLPKEDTTGAQERSEEEIYQDMLARSLLSEGNNYRIKKVIEKARNGEEVLLAYIGGSITEGANTSDAMCYVTKSCEGFAALAGAESAGNVSCVNAGMSGTSSALGIMRYDRDIVERTGKQPDVVFIEFSVNDWQEPTKGEAFESLIRRVYGAENEPAVVLVFSVFQSRWNMQSDYIPLGKLYNLPMVSILDAVVPALDEEHTLTDEQFFSDIYHPTQYGHKIMADCISYMFAQLDAAEADEPCGMPEKSWYGDRYENVVMVDAVRQREDVVVSAGGFSETDTALGTFRYDKSLKTFPDNWMHGAGGSGETFRLTLTCKGLLMAYKQSSDKNFGSADVYVDGEFLMKLDGYSEGGWNNPVPVQLIHGKEAAEHTVEIRMSEGSQEKAFSILAFAAGV